MRRLAMNARSFYHSQPMLVIACRLACGKSWLVFLLLVIFTVYKIQSMLAELTNLTASKGSEISSEGQLGHFSEDLNPFDFQPRTDYLHLGTKTTSKSLEISDKEGFNLDALVAKNVNWIINDQKLMGSCQHKNKTVCRRYFIPRTELEPFRYDFVIENRDKCSNDTEMIVLVHSLHSYFSKRDAIRRSWGKAVTEGVWPVGQGHFLPINTRMKLLFVLGLSSDPEMNRKVQEEDSAHRDIIQGDFIDHYHNMTLKSLSGFKWIVRNCVRAKYLLKSDDDMFINFPYLLSIIYKTSFHWSIMGPKNMGSKVYRSGKWGISLDEYPFYAYPTYEGGSAYVIDSSLIEPFLSLSERVPHIFIDDAYITGILGLILNVTHVSHPGFASAISRKVQPCHVAKNIVVTGIKADPSHMVWLWEELAKGLEGCGDMVTDLDYYGNKRNIHKQLLDQVRQSRI